jgi:hypothetical protein
MAGNDEVECIVPAACDKRHNMLQCRAVPKCPAIEGDAAVAATVPLRFTKGGSQRAFVPLM